MPKTEFYTGRIGVLFQVVQIQYLHFIRILLGKKTKRSQQKKLICMTQAHFSRNVERKEDTSPFSLPLTKSCGGRNEASQTKK